MYIHTHTTCYIMYTVCYILCTMNSILYTIRYMLYAMSSILYTIVYYNGIYCTNFIYGSSGSSHHKVWVLDSARRADSNVS